MGSKRVFVCVCVFSFCKMSEITDYWYADGNNSKRRETIDEAEEEGENCWRGNI